MSKDFRKLQKIVSLGVSLVIPLQSSLVVTLPASNTYLATHKPFPPDLPTIAGILPPLTTGFDDPIEIMSSLQRPRKIIIRGSDGQKYVFLCKPEDDLRKDSRLMEFNAIVNKLLKRDPEARKRHLKIRTYAVVPLNEKCGLIQWVNNMAGFRHILIKAYKARNQYIHVNQSAAHI